MVKEKYTKKSERSMASNGANGIPNAFADFRSPDGKYKVYTYYLPRYSEIRIIVDSQADTVEGYKYTAQTGKTVTPKVVLWGLPQAPDGHNVSDALNAVNMVNYGAMTVMLMPDNSLFIHDGGDLEQWSNQGCADFLAFCRELTGTDTEKMIINTWALSHAHHDHFRGFWRFLSKHHDQFDLKNVMYNIDRERTAEKYDITGAMKLVREVYPNVRYYKPHTGEQLTIAGVTVDILYTQEDRFVPNGNNELIIDGDDLMGGTYRATLLDSETQAADFNDTSTVMKFTFNPGATYEETSGRYFSRSQGIYAKYLGDTVYLAIYAKLSDGTYAYSRLAGYSAVQYATSQLKNSSDTKLKQLVVAMLNYGAQAQLHFGHNTGALANASLTADQLSLPNPYHSGMVSSLPTVPAGKQGVFANNSGFSNRKPAISFEGAFCINYFFTPKYTPDNGITLYYWNVQDYNAADVLTIANATGSFKLEGSGTGSYRGDITGIPAKALSEAVYVACAYKNGGTVWTSGVLGYSIGAYCSSQASKGGTIADLAMATAVYGYHAKQYFG